MERTKTTFMKHAYNIQYYKSQQDSYFELTAEHKRAVNLS